MSDWAGLAWLVVLLAFNAFFVGAEFAVISARRSQIEPLAEKGSRAAKTALWAMEHATLMLATAQLGITICSLLILNVSEPAIHHLLAVPLGLTGLGEAAVDVTAFVVALLVVSYLHVVFGEMVPKNLAFSLPDRAVLLLATPLVWVSKLFHPIIVSLNWIANHAVRLFRVEPRNEAASTFTLEEVATIVNQSRIEGVLDDVTGAVAAAVEFTDKKAGDVAVPLSALVTLPQSTTPDEIERAVARHGFSRYVIVDDEGAPVGYVHLKDVLREAEGADAAVVTAEPVKPKRIHHMVPVSETTDLEDALAVMRRSSRHLAQVRDATGRTTAVLFLEDILEELVGEVQDATRRLR
ncbi:hemolysin family protein [Microbacterium sp. zg.Y1090]|uniref:hemolysin family protein n=1 Tax=Microbacterium TaxID=33882 RepID=UPI00214BA3BD|nr:MULTISPECIES: hemolysin family protein [unclassified Microbacterium]MCR2813535.1 hemolysin family protein [Microbacterium sp. zg.Y1084]MCR2818128.1 hemolysin family protein [Microbacterium sp. zg.Y1090]MDL5486650.1 hemolysin family protein [Microbacterium sp. zg-Y1211]WIM27717.1 hemolysin family protein [Microbacterium sp. zg-Y1090]